MKMMIKLKNLLACLYPHVQQDKTSMRAVSPAGFAVGLLLVWVIVFAIRLSFPTFAEICQALSNLNSAMVEEVEAAYAGSQTGGKDFSVARTAVYAVFKGAYDGLGTAILGLLVTAIFSGYTVAQGYPRVVRVVATFMLAISYLLLWFIAFHAMRIRFSLDELSYAWGALQTFGPFLLIAFIFID